MNKKPVLNLQKKSIDFTLLTVVVILVILGLVFVYDVSVVQAFKDFGDSYYYIRQQFIWALLGFFSALFFTNFNFGNLKRFSTPFFILSLIALVTVFIPGFGSEAGGAHRWLNLYYFTVQPAEILKLSTVLYFATIFEKKTNFKILLIVLLFVSFVMGFLQKDLGSTIVFVSTLILLYVTAGGSLLQILVTLPLFILVLVLLIVSSEYRKKRIFAFLDPFSDPQGFTYHISQILVALGSGSILGLGLGQSRQKFYIPEVTTDSIFAVIGEETGILGGVLVISLFTIFIIRGFRIAANSTDKFGQILASGITCWIGIQAIINLGAMVSLFPLTGVPLPFISYGGSALVANLTAVGILLNISKRK